MKLLLKVCTFMLLVVCTYSCGDDTGGLEITIHSPANNAAFNRGETIVLSYTVRDDVKITTIAWDTNPRFGTGSVQGSEVLGQINEYSGDFVIAADTDPGIYHKDVIATDEGITNVLSESVTIIIQ